MIQCITILTKSSSILLFAKVKQLVLIQNITYTTCPCLRKYHLVQVAYNKFHTYTDDN